LAGLCATAAILAVVGNGNGRVATCADAPPTAPAAPRGTGSCSAVACHGGAHRAATKVLRDEYTTWILRDRHADAFKVLFMERSRSIATNLSEGRTPAYKDARCLACHATPRPDPSAALRESEMLLPDGVGCESCHGPADRWIGEHTHRDWSGRSLADKERFGMVATADLVRRAQVCTGCHVGEPARDGQPAREVDHVLIAAGHPWLRFEFAAFLAAMPHHWRDEGGPDASADFPARAWAVGQLVTAKAALELLVDRANRARPGVARDRPVAWPEYSEFGCFSCHHDLRNDAWKRDKTAASGRSRWGTWAYSMLEVQAASGTAGEARGVMAGLEAVRRLMNEPRPDPAEVVREAGAASASLGRLLSIVSGRGYDAARVEAMLSTALSLPARGGVASWEQATQRYLALVSLSQALRALAPGRADPGRAEDLERLRDYLRYPRGFDSPKAFDPAAAPSVR
jgi:predicted CxxxxCH...CXXCH cytochrome family protein